MLSSLWTRWSAAVEFGDYILTSIMASECISHNYTPTTSTHTYTHTLEINRKHAHFNTCDSPSPIQALSGGKGHFFKDQMLSRGFSSHFSKMDNLLIGVSWRNVLCARLPFQYFLCSFLFPGSILSPWPHMSRIPSSTAHRLAIPPWWSESSALLTSPRTAYLKRDDSIVIPQGQGLCWEM